MGKDEKEDSGFGFKDKAKAEDTLRLLEEHDPNYRRLTVRGLLGRAKRTLSMTKAADKKKNISEAIEVFENWLADLESSKDAKNGDKGSKNEKKTEKKENSPKEATEKVPNLGFKDKESVDATFKELEDRDPDYQKLAIKGLLGSAKRTLTATRDETKLANIKDAIARFEKFLEDFDKKDLSKNNNRYVSLGIVKTASKLAGDEVTDLQKAFIAEYENVKGDYKILRTRKHNADDKTWDIIRNRVLKDLKEKHANIKLFTDAKEPTKEHIELLLWAYSPDPTQAKKLIPEEENDISEKMETEDSQSSRKRKSNANDESPTKKLKE